MAIPKTLSTDPHAVVAPDDRWRPGEAELRNMPIGHLLPPMVDKIRRAVKKWRDEGYPNISDTSRALLQWWFCRDPELNSGVRYYFAQREAMESVVYLYETAKVRGKYGLLPYSSVNVDYQKLMEEDWTRFAVKMATGSGKTKVMSLAILWSYFHKTYEENSDLSRNILLIAPNIIVLDRLRRDFDDLRIFRDDGVLPDNGYEGRDWQNDFQMRLHIQDDVRVAHAAGNLYLTNIHRVYPGDKDPPTADDEDSRDYFLGARPPANIKKSKTDLSDIVRESGELLVINDEAHHIHDPRMAWFRSIRDIHNGLVQKGAALSLQLDMTATPKHNNGAIFPQTISDYPLVEAIHQNIVKRPILPDDESAGKLEERQHPRYSEQYADFIELGVKEWRKARDVHKQAGKKAVLFVMTDDTKNCDELAEYLQNEFSDLENKVLVIHTKNNGEIDEKGSGKKEKELQELRRNAANIDRVDNQYSAVVSVLVLREGWDVRNVTTIVGLRAYSAKSGILPEQTLGRGLRLMYGDDGADEKVSVIGSPAFVDFVKKIEQEGVKLETVKMGDGAAAQAPLIVAIDRDHPKKDIAALDIALPVLSRRFVTDFTAVFNLKAADIPVEAAEYKQYDTATAPREIVFIDVLTGEPDHAIMLGDGMNQDYSNVIAYFVRCIFKRFRFFSGYDYFYELTEEFVRDFLFGESVPLDSPDTLRNLAEIPTVKKLTDALCGAISNAIRKETDGVHIQSEVRVSDMRPFAAKLQKFYAPRKSAQNCVIAAGNRLELDFAEFLDSCADVAAFAKNYFAVGFHVEYIRTDGVLSRYFPDFLVKDAAAKLWIVETKGRMDDNDKHKMVRLEQWCNDVNRLRSGAAIGCLLVMENNFRKFQPKGFESLVEICGQGGDAIKQE